MLRVLLSSVLALALACAVAMPDPPTTPPQASQVCDDGNPCTAVEAGAHPQLVLAIEAPAQALADCEFVAAAAPDPAKDSDDGENWPPPAAALADPCAVCDGAQPGPAGAPDAPWPSPAPTCNDGNICNACTDCQTEVAMWHTNTDATATLILVWGAGDACGCSSIVSPHVLHVLHAPNPAAEVPAPDHALRPVLVHSRQHVHARPLPDLTTPRVVRTRYGTTVLHC